MQTLSIQTMHTEEKNSLFKMPKHELWATLPHRTFKVCSMFRTSVTQYLTVIELVYEAGLQYKAYPDLPSIVLKASTDEAHNAGGPQEAPAPDISSLSGSKHLQQQQRAKAPPQPSFFAWENANTLIGMMSDHTCICY